MNVKELSGEFHRIYRVKGGLYGIETITLDKGKVIDQSLDEENYPPVTMGKFNKIAFSDAQNRFDNVQKVTE